MHLFIERVSMTTPDKIPGLSDLVIEGISEAIIVVDSDGIITFVNTATLAMFGYERDEIVGKEVETLIPHALRNKHADYRHDYLETPHKRPMGLLLELSALRKDGSRFPVEIGLDTVEIGSFAIPSIP